MYQYIQIWLQFIYLFMACLRTSVMNLGPPEYEAGVLHSTTTFSVT